MITFKTVKWKNFLSTGDTFTEICLTNKKTNLILGKNGAGKSTILDALTFTLFGKPYRKINKPMIPNSINQKNCVAIVEFSIGNNEYKIVRGIKPTLFEIWQNGSLLDQSASIVDQQKQLEQNILKMNYKSFTQIVVLGSSNFVPFMRLPVASRREIIEDILDIQIFSVMNQNLKEKLKFSNDDIKERDYQIELLSNQVDMQQEFISSMEQKTDEEIKTKEKKAIELLEEKTTLQRDADKRSLVALDLLDKSNKYANKGSGLLKLTSLKGQLQQRYETQKSQKDFFTKETSCPTCGQHIDDEIKNSRLASIENAIAEFSDGIEKIQIAIQEEENKFQEFTDIQKQIDDNNAQVNFINTTTNRIQKNINQLYTEIQELKTKSGDCEQAHTKLKDLQTKFDDAKKQLIVVKEERECLQTATILLKDNGIKTRIIKRYLPIMNKLVNDYLDKMDFYVNFTLNESFEETIKSRYRDVFSYESFSEGEKARIDIALLLTWRSVAKLKNSVDTNLLILDEIFDGSLDQNGTGDLGWILRTFDDNTNVFVISHKESIEDKFEATWTFEKKKNFSYVRETTYEVAQGE